MKARDGGDPSDTIKVEVTPDGKDAFEVSCRVTDVNANKTLDVGDKVVCLEPADNRLGPDIAGKGGGRRALREHRRQRGAHRRRDLDAGDVR